MKPMKSSDSAAISAKITERVQTWAGWRGDMLARLRALIHDADPAIEEE